MNLYIFKLDLFQFGPGCIFRHGFYTAAAGQCITVAAQCCSASGKVLGDLGAASGCE